MTAQLMVRARPKIRWQVTLALLSISALVATTLSSCSSARKAPSTETSVRGTVVESTGGYGPPEPYGPKPDPAEGANQQNTTGPEPAPAYGPEPVQVRSVTLVLGPGRARGFAHAGAIRALADAKIPIGAIYASETGGLVGAIYAQEAKVNQLDWSLIRFKEETLKLESRLFSGLLGGNDLLTSELEKVFGQRDLGDLKIPVHIALKLQNSGAVTIADRGSAVQAIRAALGTPTHPGQWNGEPAVSAGSARPFMVSEAAASGAGPVIVIDTSIKGASEVETAGADFVLRPELKGMQDNDFQKRTDAVFAGKKAVAKRLNEIRQKVGLPPVSGTEDEKASANQ